MDLGKDYVKFFISTKADLVTARVNEFLEELRQKEGIWIVVEITPFMSYAGEKGYMIGCMIRYAEENRVSFNINLDNSFNMFSSPDYPYND